MKYVKLGDVCEFINGDRGKNYPSSKDFVDKGIPFINAGHVQNNDISFENMNYISKEKFNKLGSGKVKKNDILYCLRGSLGKNAIVNIEEGAIASSLVILRSKTEDIDVNYLIKYLNSNYIKEQILKYNNGSSQPNLSAASVKNFNIYLPNYEKQKEISRILDKAQQLIDKRKEQIEALDELVKSKFIEMFGDPILNKKGWEVKRLGEVCEMKAGKNIKAADIYPENIGELYPCYGGNGLRGYVKEYSHDGNIPLIGRQGALCGNVKYAQGKFYATEHAVVTQPKIEMNSYWLYFILEQLDLNRLSTGAAQPGLTVGKLNEVELPISPIELQNKFEEFALQVDKLKFEMEKSLKELEDNFNSLMQKAFKGELFD